MIDQINYHLIKIFINGIKIFIKIFGKLICFIIYKI